MSMHATSRRSVIGGAVYSLLNPIPFGFFAAGLIFDVTYANTAVVMWGKAADWLIVFGLLFAIVPRLINAVQVWVISRRSTTSFDKLDFWLNLLAIVAAIFNAFVHSRDAYEVVPAGVYLSICTVTLMAVGYIVLGVQRAKAGSIVHE